ncbi:hypothetical protein MIND_00613400 [Mycena indigotica]|uniref:Uncharacterized protein n=1 Tax=Mycena indigotica TaxID=2126181 RepID=A0A8H6STV0_9AGAR|nr:uncharacterized protein MIND_00613400 [Mycena indigotica]KAF7303835.1 hypothetical protein MIND_00613400 [Mycena indigotica]
MPPGFLLVTSEPGESVSLEEFQDWYNHEHVPLRLDHLPSFLTGARFSAADSQTPSWLAVYDIDDTATFQHHSYTRLRANRSPREADLVQRLAILDRRTYKLCKDSGESALTSSYKPDNPTRHIITHWVDFPAGDEAFEGWSDTLLRALTGIDGWVRTRTYKCIDNLKTGRSVPSAPEAQIVPQYLVIHELLTLQVDVANSNPDSLAELRESRSWNLYRAYPSVAQTLNVKSSLSK